MDASISTLLDAPPDRVWEEVQKPALLAHVAAPLVSFEPVNPRSLPDTWEEGGYLVGLKLFGAVPLGTQTIRISNVRVDDTPGERFYRIRDDGTGRIASEWTHVISIRETSDGKTVYVDEVEVKAGVLTPVVWSFASLFYRYRQHRLRKLVANGFEY
ncbi:hypothetical protein [Halegenticoccus tardaugens]|uniref:hypothetical protein n=1 Tax=Halegenticoccus tardaugens TaxID=2071624 RepID=UPI00100A600F|nr:hypothetical protein [Halegenticoccus tardaugens]